MSHKSSISDRVIYRKLMVLSFVTTEALGILFSVTKAKSLSEGAMVSKAAFLRKEK